MLLFLIHHYGSPRTCLIIVNMFRCQHATFCGFVSGYRSPRTRWICDFIMFVLIRSVAIKLGTFQRFFSPSRTNFPVLDNWVLGFGSIRWLLPAISESKSHVRISLCEIVGGGRSDTYTFWFSTSSDFITITFEIHKAGSVSYRMIAFDFV